MTDLNGVELQVGDEVVYTNRNLNDLRKGEVFRITKSKVIVKYSPDFQYTWTDGAGVIHNAVAKRHDNVMYGGQVMKL